MQRFAPPEFIFIFPKALLFNIIKFRLPFVNLDDPLLEFNYIFLVTLSTAYKIKKLKYFFINLSVGIINLLSTFKMSADQTFARAIRTLSEINTASSNTHTSNEYIEYLQNELINTVRILVYTNRQNVAIQAQANRMRHPIATGNVSVRRLTGPYTAPLRPTTATRRNPLEKTVVIAKKKLETNCPSECAICQETPKYKDAVCTECDHYYCKSCWTGWMNAERSNKKCPTCRKDMPRTTSYKARASKATKPLTGPMTAPLRQVMIIEDDDNDVSHMSASVDDF